MSFWNTLPCKSNVLQLPPVLLGGQSFRWKIINDKEYIGVFAGKVWHLKQEEDCIIYKTYGGEKVVGTINSKLLTQYFRLDEDLSQLYLQWSERDDHFKKSSEQFYGIRILNQDILENLFAFICSSNNNIARISSMVEKLCRMYGNIIATVEDEQYFSFPDVKALTGEEVEKQLREAGFGYRAKFIHQTACKISESGTASWLKNIKSLPYPEAKLELMKLHGVGAKVADCICLMSLNHLGAVPVDTHVFQIACNRYLPHLKGKKSVTDRIYNEVADHFRGIFGEYAGWAHTILFCADLKSFKDKDKSKPRKRKSTVAD